MVNSVNELEQISYAKTVYGQEEIAAVVKCLSESTQMGNYSRQFEQKIANLFCLLWTQESQSFHLKKWWGWLKQYTTDN